MVERDGLQIRIRKDTVGSNPILCSSYVSVAQLAEQWPPNPKVVGSIPT